MTLAAPEGAVRTSAHDHVDEECVNALLALSIDAVEEARSGHLGARGQPWPAPA